MMYFKLSCHHRLIVNEYNMVWDLCVQFLYYLTQCRHLPHSNPASTKKSKQCHDIIHSQSKLSHEDNEVLGESFATQSQGEQAICLISCPNTSLGVLSCIYKIAFAGDSKTVLGGGAVCHIPQEQRLWWQTYRDQEQLLFIVPSHDSIINISHPMYT